MSNDDKDLDFDERLRRAHKLRESPGFADSFTGALYKIAGGLLVSAVIVVIAVVIYNLV